MGGIYKCAIFNIREKAMMHAFKVICRKFAAINKNKICSHASIFLTGLNRNRSFENTSLDDYLLQAKDFRELF
ncbi:hypothetical protein GZ77_21605 [Endozoicomonas montiporae]|uniref:Uncharacterized protein n=1 Tax=Endozoicomonas montiporae TaxID=1027273 RepID=A0A081N3J4_9GAMM|nr:hypothetical protein GZ77_21605 [Endozoicomonas montiporae]